MRDGESVEEEISEAEFESLVRTHGGAIPIHAYSSQSLALLLKQVGLELMREQMFHHNENYPRGRDVLIIAKKR